MVMLFTKEEIKYINARKGMWSVSSECPQELRRTIEKKINALRVRKSNGS